MDKNWKKILDEISLHNNRVKPVEVDKYPDIPRSIFKTLYSNTILEVEKSDNVCPCDIKHLDYWHNLDQHFEPIILQDWNIFKTIIRYRSFVYPMKFFNQKLIWIQSLTDISFEPKFFGPETWWVPSKFWSWNFLVPKSF